MTLPSSGNITFAQINVELGRSASAPLNLNEAAVRALAGVPSGAINMANFYGKSAGPTFNYPPGYYQDSQYGAAAFTVTASATCVWTWSRAGSTGGTGTPASGGSSTQFTAQMPSGPVGQVRTSVFTVYATYNSIQYGPWDITVECDKT